MEKNLENDFKTCKTINVAPKRNDFSDATPFKIWTKESNYQVHSVIGGIAPNYLDEQRRTTNLLTNILGGPALNSRLNLSIREKYGYSYTVEAVYSPFVDTGYWAVYFGTDPKYIKKSIDLVYKELRKLREQKMGVLQLNSAKEQLKGHLALGLDSNSGLMLGLGKSLLLFNQIDTIPEIYKSIDKLTAENLLETANMYYDENNISELVFDIEK